MSTAPLTVRCPKCKAKAGYPCVYFKTHWKWDEGKHKVIVLHKEGDPTERFHNERFNLASLPSRIRDRSAVPRINPALAAVRDYELREYNQTRDWLRANWAIFQVGTRQETADG